MTAPENTKITTAEQIGATPAEVRAWCAEQGIECGKTGRISSETLQKYADAH